MAAHQILKYEVKDGVLRLLIILEIISLEKEILDFVKKVVLSTKHQVSHYIPLFQQLTLIIVYIKNQKISDILLSIIVQCTLVTRVHISKRTVFIP